MYYLLKKLMKGEEGSEWVICIKNEDGDLFKEIVKLNYCGSLECCWFEFKELTCPRSTYGFVFSQFPS